MDSAAQVISLFGYENPALTGLVSQWAAGAQPLHVLLPEGRFVTNDPMTISRWLVAGAGIAYVPLMWVINEINSGVLEILFPRYQSDPRPVYALYTEKDKLPLKVQVCINYLTEYFVDVAELFQGMRGRRKE